MINPNKTDLWIENISQEDIIKGRHYLDPQKTALIQIVDINSVFPEPKYKKDFKYIFKFSFNDTESEADNKTITEENAKLIAQKLQECYSQGLNIVVHCYVGVYRSGAVVQAGLLLGYKEARDFRIPNTLVLAKITKYLIR